LQLQIVVNGENLWIILFVHAGGNTYIWLNVIGLLLAEKIILSGREKIIFSARIGLLLVEKSFPSQKIFLVALAFEIFLVYFDFFVAFKIFLVSGFIFSLLLLLNIYLENFGGQL